MLKLKHKKLQVYIKSKQLVLMSYNLSALIPQSEIYGLISQIRRSSVSIISNIAEGAARKSAIERKRFYEISRSSVVELDTQIEIALSLNFIKTIPIEFKKKLTKFLQCCQK